jgi:hypothetical protein
MTDQRQQWANPADCVVLKLLGFLEFLMFSIVFIGLFEG